MVQSSCWFFRESIKPKRGWRKKLPPVIHHIRFIILLLKKIVPWGDSRTMPHFYLLSNSKVATYFSPILWRWVLKTFLISLDFLQLHMFSIFWDVLVSAPSVIILGNDLVHSDSDKTMKLNKCFASVFRYIVKYHVPVISRYRDLCLMFENCCSVVMILVLRVLLVYPQSCFTSALTHHAHRSFSFLYGFQKPTLARYLNTILWYAFTQIWCT